MKPSIFSATQRGISMPSRCANCAMRAKLWKGMTPGTIGTVTPSARACSTKWK